MLKRLPQRNVRPTAAFKLNCAGPVTELRPAFPHCPGCGRGVGQRVQIVAVRHVVHWRAGQLRPRRCRRSRCRARARDTPASAAVPLPVVNCVTKVQSFSRRPLQSVHQRAAGDARAGRVLRLRRRTGAADRSSSGAYSASRFSQSCAMPTPDRLAPRKRGRVVGGLGERVLHRRGEAVAQAAAQLHLAGVAQRACRSRSDRRSPTGTWRTGSPRRPDRCSAGTPASGACPREPR